MQFFLVREHGRWGVCETGADCAKKNPKNNRRVIKDWQLSQKKNAETSKETQPRPSLLPSPLHTPTHTVFVGWGDNNGSWRSRDRRLQTLTASCYVMNVWLPPLPPPNITPIWCYWLWVRLPTCSIWTEQCTQKKAGKGATAMTGVKQGVMFINAPAVIHLCAVRCTQKYFTLKGESDVIIC